MREGAMMIPPSMSEGPDAEGWLPAARRVASPNFDERPAGEAISLVVIHAISLPPGVFGGQFIEHLFLNELDVDAHPYFASLRDLKVSAHFLIARDGTLIQFVSCLSRAWHAGVSTWNGRLRCNDFSIGIELEGDDGHAFEEAQYASLMLLIAALQQRYPIESIVGHADVAPGRKTDPGPMFDWGRLSGISVPTVDR